MTRKIDKMPPLSAGLHRDGSIHIYRFGRDMGLQISEDPNGDGVILSQFIVMAKE